MFEKLKILFKSKKDTRQYDLDTVEGILSIDIPKYETNNGIAFPDKNIEYILQKKATEYKRSGRMDLAIACLKKSNEIMPYSNFAWGAKDYLRLIEYLKIDGKFDEAKKEEKKLRETLPHLFDGKDKAKREENLRRFAQWESMGIDLVRTTTHHPTCAECAILQGRIFSLSGKDQRFPALPAHIKASGVIHDGCKHTFCAYSERFVSEQELNELIIFSNRPFADERSEEEKQRYDEMMKRSVQYQQDKRNYDLIREQLPELAPKSFNAFRRMKNTNSTGYKKIIDAIDKAGISFDEKN